MTLPISSEELYKIKDFLKAVHEMAQNEDWNESRAQELIMDGADLYENLFG